MAASVTLGSTGPARLAPRSSRRTALSCSSLRVMVLKPLDPFRVGFRAESRGLEPPSGPSDGDETARAGGVSPLGGTAPAPQSKPVAPQLAPRGRRTAPSVAFRWGLSVLAAGPAATDTTPIACGCVQGPKPATTSDDDPELSQAGALAFRLSFAREVEAPCSRLRSPMLSGKRASSKRERNRSGEWAGMVGLQGARASPAASSNLEVPSTPPGGRRLRAGNEAALGQLNRSQSLA